MSGIESPPLTQQSSGSQRIYSWVFLFEININNENPFICLSLDHFRNTDFPFELINGHMGLSDRLKPRNLSGLPGSKYYIFAKVEQGTFTFFISFNALQPIPTVFLKKGVVSKRRNDKITRLNERYIDSLGIKNTIQRCFKYLCQSEPYRMYKENADPIPTEVRIIVMSLVISSFKNVFIGRIADILFF